MYVYISFHTHGIVNTFVVRKYKITKSNNHETDKITLWLKFSVRFGIMSYRKTIVRL